MVHFVGAGPGAPDLITLRGAEYLKQADVVIYAGSLVNPALLGMCKSDCKIYNSAEMTLEQVIDVMKEAESEGKTILRLHTGDPCLYGAIREQMDMLDELGIFYDDTPGVSSFCGAAAAITRALEHAGLNPEDVDYINAHGTSTPLNDKYETAAIKLALGDSARKVSVSSVKGTIGHGLGAAGGLESICCIEAIRNSVVPPTINYENPDPECDLDITPNTARERKVDVALNINLGFGGHNGVLAFKRI